ncbi:MAG: hypothetical protein WBS24_07815 [Terriglobales bacterium]
MSLAPFILAGICAISPAAPCESDQSAAARVLGPQWKQLSRRAGMVFAGTVLSGPLQGGAALMGRVSTGSVQAISSQISQTNSAPTKLPSAISAQIIPAQTAHGQSTSAETVPQQPVPTQIAPLDNLRMDRGVPFTTLRFRVDHAIAGVEAGQILTIHEWKGAQSLHAPMRAGERFLIFLYPPSRLGLTSPVAGRQGQFRLDKADRTIQGSVTVYQLARAIRSARGK